jgi:2'-5' RNA ligase
MDAGYEAACGTYCLLTTSWTEQDVLKSLFLFRPPVRLSELHDNLHVTVLRSNHSLPIVVCKELRNAYLPIHVRVQKVAYWQGLDGAGHIVAIVDSLELTALHELAVKLGAIHTYGSFVPHITLATRVGEETRDIQQWLCRINTTLPSKSVCFTQIAFKNLKNP